MDQDWVRDGFFVGFLPSIIGMTPRGGTTTRPKRARAAFQDASVQFRGESSPDYWPYCFINAFLFCRMDLRFGFAAGTQSSVGQLEFLQSENSHDPDGNKDGTKVEICF